MNNKKLPRHRKSGGVHISSAVAIGRHTRKDITLFGTIVSGLMSLTIFSAPSELPDTSWRGQGRDMRKLFSQVGGFFDSVYRDEVAGRNAEKR